MLVAVSTDEMLLSIYLFIFSFLAEILSQISTKAKDLFWGDKIQERLKSKKLP